MTHNELLAKIYNVGHAVEYGHTIETSRIVNQLKSLHKVAQLHEPLNFDETLCGHCSIVEDGIYVPYPCLTVQAIQEHLK